MRGKNKVNLSPPTSSDYNNLRKNLEEGNVHLLVEQLIEYINKCTEPQGFVAASSLDPWKSLCRDAIKGVISHGYFDVLSLLVREAEDLRVNVSSNNLLSFFVEELSFGIDDIETIISTGVYEPEQIQRQIGFVIFQIITKRAACFNNEEEAAESIANEEFTNSLKKLLNTNILQDATIDLSIGYFPFENNLLIESVLNLLVKIAEENTLSNIKFIVPMNDYQEKLTAYYLRNQILQGVDNFFDVPSEMQAKAYCLAARLYRDLNSEHYDLSAAAFCYEQCGEYLPALKELLPIYIAEICDEEGKLGQLDAYELAERTAETIIKLDPTNCADAKAFLEARNNFAPSFKMHEKFIKNLYSYHDGTVFFTHENLRKMNHDFLFSRKNASDPASNLDRDEAQREWDKNFGLSIIPENQDPSSSK